MDNRIQQAFGTIHAPERLKRRTKAILRKKTLDYGRNLFRLQQRRRRLAAGLLSMTLLAGGLSLWYVPATSIGVDINPSIELKVNALDRVISVEGINSDGAALVQNMDVAGMEYDDALQRILLSSEMEPYLEKGSAITITLAGSSKTHGEEMLSRVLCRAYNIAEEENVLYCQVDWETLRAAREVNLCIPRYLAWQNLRESDPAITPEDVRQIPQEKIRVLAQNIIIEDPCH